MGIKEISRNQIVFQALIVRRIYPVVITEYTEYAFFINENDLAAGIKAKARVFMII